MISSSKNTSLFSARIPTLRLLILILLFVMPLSLRLYQIDEPPMDFNPICQYHSPILARGFYEELLYGETESVPPDGIVEPPILEGIASLAYYAVGSEQFCILRLLSAVFWMVSGVFLYLKVIVRRTLY